MAPLAGRCVFSQNGFRSVEPGATVKLVAANNPGHIYRSTIADIVQGGGRGQIAVSGIVARAESIGTSMDYPALINASADMDRSMLRLGMVGTATVTDNAGPSESWRIFFWGPRKISTARQPPRNCSRMIPVCSPSDSMGSSQRRRRPQATAIFRGPLLWVTAYARSTSDRNRPSFREPLTISPRRSLDATSI
jgi:hypothetical protein